MALTLNNITGFETQDTKEAQVESGSDFTTTNPRSGASCLILNTAGNQFTLPWIVLGATDAGSDYIIGMAIRKSGNPGSDFSIATVLDDSSSAVLAIALTTSGTIDLKDAEAAVLDTSFALNNDQWYYIEIYAEINSASGAWEWFIDGSSEGSDTGADLTDGNSFGTSTSTRLILQDIGSSDEICFDDVYILSGATAATDRLGGTTAAEMPEVFGYQSGPNTTRTGTPTNGTFTETGDTPGVDEADDTALEAAGASALTLTCDLDEGSNARGLEGGPAAGAADVSGTIIGAKWIYNLKRSNGSGTSMRYLFGNSLDGETSSADIEADLTTGFPGIKEQISESDTIAPITKTGDTYHFDTSDAGPTDNDSVWTDDANAFDGSISTLASVGTNGGETTNELRGEGTSAPGSGGTIGTVYARIYGDGDSGTTDYALIIYTDGEGESLLAVSSQDVPDDPGFTPYNALSVPSGGWTFAKIQALEAIIYRSSGPTLSVYKIEIFVEHTSGAETLIPDFSIGISAGTDDTGGRNIFAADIWAMLLHVSAAPPPADFPDEFLVSQFDPTQLRM